MVPVEFTQQNFVYTKPKGWTDDQCSDLHVWKGSVDIGDDKTPMPTIVSCWQPSAEDIEAINAGQPIFMLITSDNQPPISITTINPFI